MAALQLTVFTIFFFTGFLTVTVDAANNTTQFDNFTIEWDDFNILTCAVPVSINISLFTCFPEAVYGQINDTICLTETTVNFDPTTCTTTTATTVTNPLTTVVTSTRRETQTTTRTTTASTTPTTTTTTTGFTSTAARSTASSTSTGRSSTASSTSTAGRSTASSISTGRTSTASVSSTGGSSTTSSTRIERTSMVSVSTTRETSTASSSSTARTSTARFSSTEGIIANRPTSIMTDSDAQSTVAYTTIPALEEMTLTTSMVMDSSPSAADTSIAVSLTNTSIDLYYCTNDFIGTYCNMSADACALSQPCQNAATCFPNNTLPLGYYCVCRVGFAGYDCEWDIQSCQENTCWHNGTCIPVNITVAENNGSNFRCQCVEGYNGVYCELEVDQCRDVICENRGTCETIEAQWKCLCLDSTYYYGNYCQYETTALRLRQILSKSFAAVAIGVIITTCTFVVVMDILKYAFHIDPVVFERDSYRRRREALKRARKPLNSNEPRIAIRFQYVS